MAIVEWPSRSCTTFAGNSSPPGLARVDAPAGEEVAQRMQAGIFRMPDRLALLVDANLAFGVLHGRTQPGRDLRCCQSLGDHRVAFDVAAAVRERQVERALRASQLPLPQSVEHRRRKRDRALAGLALRRSELVMPIGALADVEFGSARFRQGCGRVLDRRGSRTRPARAGTVAPSAGCGIARPALAPQRTDLDIIGTEGDDSAQTRATMFSKCSKCGVIGLTVCLCAIGGEIARSSGRTGRRVTLHHPQQRR
jgi:hypothetical protein